MLTMSMLPVLRPVAEQGALDAIRPRQHRQLGGGHPWPLSFVGVDGDAHLGSRLEVSAEPLHLIRKLTLGVLSTSTVAGRFRIMGRAAARLVDDGVTHLDGGTPTSVLLKLSGEWKLETPAHGECPVEHICAGSG